MRQQTIRTLILVSLLLLTGCVQSLQRVISPSDGQRDEALEGVWANGEDTLTIPKASVPNGHAYCGYAVRYDTPDGKSTHYLLRVTSIREQKYWQAEYSDDDAFLRLSTFPFGRYRIKDSKLFFDSPNKEAWRKVATQQRLPFVERDGCIVLTADKKQLHEVLANHGNDLFFTSSTGYLMQQGAASGPTSMRTPPIAPAHGSGLPPQQEM